MNLVDVENDIIGRFLTQYGEWADLEVRFIADNIVDGSTVADIGAYLGTFGIGLSQRKNLESICFIEANARVIPLLQQNVQRNCRAPHNIIEALVNFRGYRSAKGIVERGNLGSLSFANKDRSASDIEIPVPSARTTLNQLNRRYGPFGFVKLDVEGMEFGILAASRSLLSEGKTTIWAECNENLQSLDLADLLRSTGLKVYYFAFPSFNPDNFRNCPDPIFPFAYEGGLLACSHEPKFDDSLRAAGCLLKRIDDREMLRQALWRTPRWAPNQMWSEDPEESVALAVHALRAETYANFLVSQPPTEIVPSEEWSPVLKLQNRSRHAEEALSRAEGLVAERDAQLAKLEEMVRQFEGGLALAEGLVAERDTQVERLSEQVRQFEGGLALAEGLVAERDTQIERLREQVRQFEGELALAEGLVAERDTQVEKLNACLRDLQEVLSRAQAARARAEKISSGRSSYIRRIEEELSHTRTIAEDRSAQIDNLNAALQFSERLATDRLLLVHAERSFRSKMEGELKSEQDLRHRIEQNAQSDLASLQTKADQDLRKLIAMVEDRDQRLVAGNQELLQVLEKSDKDLRTLLDEVEVREQRLREADTELRRLIATVEDRDRRLVAGNQELLQVLEKSDKDLRTLLDEVEVREQRLREADTELRRLVAMVEDRDQELDTLKQLLRTIETSIPWRIAKTLKNALRIRST
jgi:FkbM family methyltransferase